MEIPWFLLRNAIVTLVRCRDTLPDVGFPEGVDGESLSRLSP